MLKASKRLTHVADREVLDSKDWIWGGQFKKKKSCTAKTVKGSHGEEIQQVLFTLQVLCLTLKIVHKLLPPKKLTQNQKVKNKFYAPEDCLT